MCNPRSDQNRQGQTMSYRMADVDALVLGGSFYGYLRNSIMEQTPIIELRV